MNIFREFILRCRGFIETRSGLLQNQKYLADFAVFFFLFGITLYFSLERQFPFLFDDEYGVLGAAAVLSGLEWSAPSDIPFYGFGLSLFIFPLYWLDLSPDVLYRLVLAINGVFVAFSAVLTLHILRQILVADEKYRFLIVLLAYCYPSVIFYSCLAMGESILLFSLVLMTYSLVELCREQNSNILNAILLGFSAALAPYAHSRGSVFTVALLMVGLLIFLKKWISRKKLLLSLLTAIIGIVLLSFIKSFLLSNFYSQVMNSSASISDFLRHGFSLIRADRLLTILQVLWGQLTYLASSTFGLFLLGLTMVFWETFSIIMTKDGWNRLGNEIERKRFLLSLFLSLTFLGTFAASLMQMIDPIRADHFFYGRYNEVMIPFIIIAGLLIFEGRKKCTQTLLYLLALIVSLVMVIVIFSYPERIFTKEIIWTQISSWFVYIHGQWIINPHFILKGVLIGGLFLVLAKSVSKYLMATVLLSFFILAIGQNSIGQFHSVDSEKMPLLRLSSHFERIMDDQVIAVYPPVWENNLNGEALQFVLPNAHVIFQDNEIYKTDALFTSISQDSFCDPSNTVALIPNYRLCILSPPLFETIVKNKGVIDTRETKTTDLPPPEISLGEYGEPKKIIISDPIWRFFSFMSRSFYSKWMQVFLPSVNVRIHWNELNGDEQFNLGCFLTDLNGHWLVEKRFVLDIPKLSKGNWLRKTVRIPLLPELKKGEYTLNFAIVNKKGWDWRSVEKVRISIR